MKIKVTLVCRNCGTKAVVSKENYNIIKEYSKKYNVASCLICGSGAILDVKNGENYETIGSTQICTQKESKEYFNYMKSKF
jgi:coenzyme F420-reducing hydrogenase beta subunit